MLNRIMSGVKATTSTVVNIIFPPSCCGCGRHVQAHSALCAACWTGMRFIERPFCEILGRPFTQDLGKGFLSAEAIGQPPDFDRLRSATVHDHVARQLVHSLKYQDRTDLAPMMAGWMIRASDGALDQADLVLPVPLHRYRFLSRKYNQSAELARHIARVTGKPFNTEALVRVKRTKQQVGLGGKAREDNVRGAFRVSDAGKSDLFGRRVVLVDDVYTTGATVNAAARALRRAGVADITVLTFAMVLAPTI